MLDSPGKFVRIPMRFIDGQWEFEFGGTVSAKHDSQAELVVQASSLEDRQLAARLLKRTRIKILEQGITLRAFLVVKDRSNLTDEKQKRLRSWDQVKGEIAPGAIVNWSTEPPWFVDVELGKATEQQARLNGSQTGGLWLCLEGTKPIGLLSSTIGLSEHITKETAISLNHAFTLLSEIYEPWRKSHTGNVYTRFLYQETNGKWYPLQLLREAHIAEAEQAIAFGLWQELMAKIAAH